jgi:hypothetical protein
MRWYLALGVTVAGIVFWSIRSPYSPFRPVNTSAENFARLKYGMTRGEVEGVLGGPSGNYSSDPRRDIHTISWCVPAGGGYGLPVFWTTDEAEVIVAFKDDGTAYCLQRQEIRSKP